MYQVIPDSSFPYEEMHALLCMAYPTVAAENFDIKMHLHIWEELYPPEMPEESAILQRSCLGHRVTREELEEVTGNGSGS